MEIINSAADCNINKYLACKFNNKYHALIIDYKGKGEELTVEQMAMLIEAFETIDTEFTDACGIQIPEINLMRIIHSMECRNEAVQKYIFVQTEWLRNAGEPYFQGFADLERQGYTLLWSGDAFDFVKQLKRIQSREAKHKIALSAKIIELDQFRKLQEKTPTTETSRKQFIKFINELQKFGYPINYETTTVEQLGVMMDAFAEHNRELMEQSAKGRR